MNFFIRNIGVGLARNLILIGVNKTKVGINHAKNKNYRLSDVKVDGTHKFEVLIDYYVTETPRVYNLMLFYTDINNNVYSVLIQSTIINSSEQNRTWYFSDTSHFNKKMEELEINYRDLVLSYEQEHLM